MSRWKLLPLRAAIALYEVGLNLVGRVPGARYLRFLSLDSRARHAVERRKYAAAVELAHELLALSEQYRGDWNYGNAVHDAHLVLGRVALAGGDVPTARTELLLAGRVPGSPQLISFGPNMRLARDLLRAGESNAVLEYFELCGRFWQMGTSALSRWKADVERNREPNFGANLHY